MGGMRTMIVVVALVAMAHTVRAIDFDRAARDALASEATSPLPRARALGLGVYMAGNEYRGESTEYIPVAVVYYRSDKASSLRKPRTSAALSGLFGVAYLF